MSRNLINQLVKLAIAAAVGAIATYLVIRYQKQIAEAWARLWAKKAKAQPKAKAKTQTNTKAAPGAAVTVELSAD